MPVLELNNVTRRYGKLKAVDNVSFHVDSGQILSLLGPSGCGKTTTLRLISGFEEPNEGSIHILDENMKGKRPYERNVGLLFQNYALFPHMTVNQNVAYGLKQRDYDKKKIPARVAEMLELVQLTGFEKRRPRQLSGGQQQRVALARALAISPAVVLLDEPLSALDAKLRLELRIELREILNTIGATTIVVTHDQEEAMSLGDVVIVMESGKIIQEGPPTEIYADPKTKFVAEFIGRSNWFAGSLGGSVSSGIREFKATAGFKAMVPEPDQAFKHEEKFEICIRPERIQILRKGKNVDADDDNINRLGGVIKDVAHLGADIHLVLKISGDRRLTVTEQFIGQTLDQTGEEVEVTFRPEDVIIVPAES
jgi:putative spermidine/putrescine transport system ATP-binding protein/putrescine transport system ATP-binding protein